ncbi:hypothetical protein Efla_005192 [Eimeria flavescens]
MQQASEGHAGHLPTGGGCTPLENGTLAACLRDAILQILRGPPVSQDKLSEIPEEEAAEAPNQHCPLLAEEANPARGLCHTERETWSVRTPVLFAESQRLTETLKFAARPDATVGAAEAEAAAATREWLLSKLHDVEAECDKTRQKLRQQELATREVQQKYVEHRDRASTLAQRVVHDLKERRLMTNQMAEVEQRLLQERETCKRLEADKKNLASLMRRTIGRLRGKLREVQAELSNARLEAGLIDSERQRAEQQTQVFRHNIKGMGDLQRNLTEELAEAREKVTSVKRAFREKIGQLQSEHEEWRKIIESHQQTVKTWEDKYEESQAQVEAARSAMDRLRRAGTVLSSRADL